MKIQQATPPENTRNPLASKGFAGFLAAFPAPNFFYCAAVVVFASLIPTWRGNGCEDEDDPR